MNNMKFIDGMNKAWDLAFRLIGEDKDVLFKMFGTDEVDEIISSNEPQYVLKKLEEYDNENRKEYVPDTNVGNKDGWIPVEERLPERKEKKKQFGNKQKRTNVLVTLRNGIVKEMMYEFETKEFWEPGDENPIEHWKEDVMDSDFEVIAWQPLPKPYREKGE